MKSDQLSIFDLDEKSKEEKFPSEKKPKRKRKPREVKKAPMLVDSFRPEKHEGTVPDKKFNIREKQGDCPQFCVPDKEPHIFTVSEITENIKKIIDGSFAEVWIAGEITDFKGRNSRHLYFTIKDERSKLRIAMFNAESRNLQFEVKDGLSVICHGKLDVYMQGGSYSLIADYIEPKGIGALQLAFEQLKKKLEAEGLFDRARKRPIPYLPKKIGVITSPTGAAIRDIIHVLTRRFPNIEVLLCPVRVQGEGAASEVAEAIAVMNKRNDIDVLIVGRGGGSIEDLWAFNEEIVARAIAASQIPVISAVGHEIDFTIADFVADVRAATPSAAAEIAVPVRDELFKKISDRRQRLSLALKQIIVNRYHEVARLKTRLGDPRRRLPDLMLHVDNFRQRLYQTMGNAMQMRRQLFMKLASNLNNLSPLGILAKGYSVVQTLDGKAVKSVKSLKINDELALRLHEGVASARVTKILDK